MKKHQKILICLMALGLIGGISTSFALSRNEGTNSYKGDLDQAIYLYWNNGNETSTASTALDALSASVAQYRSVVVAPKASNNVKGTVSVEFKLTVEDGNSLNGVDVNIYKTSTYIANTLPTEQTDLDTKQTLSTKEADKTTYTSTIEVGNGDSSPVGYYLLEIKWDGSAASENTTFGGTLTIGQSFTKTA